MIQLIQGDCLEKMKDIPDNSIDCVITDPPYGTTACKWDIIIPFEQMWEQLNRVIKYNSAIVLFGTEPFSSKLRLSNLNMYKYDWVYVKSQAQNFLNAYKQPLRNNECISVFYNTQCTYITQMEYGKPYISKRGKSNLSNSAILTKTLNDGNVTMNNGERFPLTVTKCYSSETGFHPTQKPVLLMEYLIKTYTNKNETVLDFTMGSGTTGVAAKKLNRNFIGIELDKEYFEIAKKRIENTDCSQTEIEF